MATSRTDPVEAGTSLERLIRGYQFTRALHVVVELGLPAALADGPRDLASIAEVCGADAGSLQRFLRALTSIDMLSEPEPGVFASTPMLALLRSGAPGSRRDWLVLNAVDLSQTWEQLLHSVRTGETATALVYGMDSWTYRSLNPEHAARFDAGMTENSRRRIDAFITAVNLSHAKRVVDVGGGRGALIAAIARANPSAHCVLFDLPHVVAGAPAILGPLADSGRVDVVGGDFFEGVPAEADTYVLSMILHDWDDDAARKILIRCREAMSDGGVVLLYERSLPIGTEREWEPYFSDLNMLQGPGGRERDVDEWHNLLQSAGFAVDQIVPTPIGLSIIRAVPKA